jgi:predicted MPP superfamily phosphohydrolase
MRLPWLGSFVLPRHGWRYPVGHVHVGNTQIYVSRGIGGIPMRLGCPPEATIITLRRG